MCILTASTRLLALPWNCRLLPAVWLGTVRDTGRALLGLPPLSGYREPQWTDGKLLLSFSEDSAPSRRRVGMVCCGQPRLQGVAGGVAQSRENVVGEWLRWSRGLRPATANACGQRRDKVSESLQGWNKEVLEKPSKKGLEGFEACENICQLLEGFRCVLQTHFASFPLNGVPCASAKHRIGNFHWPGGMQPHSHSTARNITSSLVGETATHFPTTDTTHSTVFCCQLLF